MTMSRRCWRYALAGAVAVVGLASIATDTQAERVRWKLHAAYASNIPIIGDTPTMMIDTVDKASGGEFKIKHFEPGALVPGNAYYDPVSSGALDSAYGTPGFNVNKNFAYAFFASVPFGPRAGEYLAWMRYGGGEDMAREMYGRDSIRFYICGIAPPETSGWFRNEIKTLDDLKGLKMRFFGLGAKVMEKFGVSTQLLAGGDIYPALELGSIDATEFSMPVTDQGYGFYQIAKHNYFPGWHQQSTINELLVNQGKYEALSDPHKELLAAACDRATLYMFVKGEASQFDAIKFHQSKGVTIHRWSDANLAKFEAAWQEVIADEIKENEDAKKIWASLSAFRKDYAIWKDNGYLK
jgi:TRAP-type mannitol/chloroaromatic compound transport system substrate-binding protein